MDFSKAIIVVVVTLLIVIGLNAAIYLSVTRKNSVGQIELLRRAASRVKDPWQSENEDLSKLAHLVEGLQTKKQEYQDKPANEDE
ncbi:MAG TPA: hypothetical protein VLM80_00565 [Anaerolineales bacterium]|nr:hypothetical protein [Anaerolineales bacterium]